MTDRELLELAAKAAEYIFTEKLTESAPGKRTGPFISHRQRWKQWNPLTDDGDAVRLAVKLEIDVWHGKWPNGKKYAAAHKVWCPNDSMYYDDGVAYKNDTYAATRRAIVCAAAEIGRGM